MSFSAATKFSVKTLLPDACDSIAKNTKSKQRQISVYHSIRNNLWEFYNLRFLLFQEISKRALVLRYATDYRNSFFI